MLASLIADPAPLPELLAAWMPPPGISVGEAIGKDDVIADIDIAGHAPFDVEAAIFRSHAVEAERMSGTLVPRARVPAEVPRALEPFVAAMARREEVGLVQLRARCGTVVRAVVARILSRADLVDDVVALTFLQAWNDAARFECVRGSVHAWLITIARSRARDALRSQLARARREVCVDDAMLQEHVERTDDESPRDIARTLEIAERDDRVRALLATLAPAQRQMLTLAFMHGLTHDEIAAHAHVPLGTVKSHILRGLAALRVRCNEAGIAR